MRALRSSSAPKQCGYKKALCSGGDTDEQQAITACRMQMQKQGLYLTLPFSKKFYPFKARTMGKLLLDNELKTVVVLETSFLVDNNFWVICVK